MKEVRLERGEEGHVKKLVVSVEMKKNLGVCNV